MSAYATVDEVAAGYRSLSETESSVCSELLDEAALIIDAYNADAAESVKKLVSCRMVRRAIGNMGAAAVPMGATQGSVSALGYSQSWQMSDGSAGQLYLERLEKKLLGVGDRIGSHSLVEDLSEATDD